MSRPKGTHPAALELGRLGGLASRQSLTPAKAAAARANGARGGRPRKDGQPAQPKTYTIQVQNEAGDWVDAPGEASGWTRAQAAAIVGMARRPTRMVSER